MKKMTNGSGRKILGIVLITGLCVSIGLNVYFAICYIKCDSYLQTTGELYIMEAGIIKNNLEFHSGTDYEFYYDLSHKNCEILKSRYRIEETAGSGTEFEKALRLMNEYAPRLTHKSDYDNHIGQGAPELLEYSLDNRNSGINCRAKAQILNEMCLALGIYSRKVWIMPYSEYDGDCHVVNEIWDSSLDKWIMLDITNNEYWADENGTPLSVLEIRSRLALQEFCTPVEAEDKTDDLPELKEKHIGEYVYIAKNMVYTVYCTDYSTGESENYYTLLPENIPAGENELIISRAAVERPPE